MGWGGAVQLVQLSWALSHPYLYIYAVLLICATFIGLQWGVWACGLTRQAMGSWTTLFALASLWVLLEWSRLFIFSGFPFNPVGLSLTASLYPLQLASLGGMYGLSFWVMLTNLACVRAWIGIGGKGRWLVVFLLAMSPYLFGWCHISHHNQGIEAEGRRLSVVLVQSAIPVEKKQSFRTAEEARQGLLEEWHHILATLKKQVGEKIDLIVFPEYLVPYGTHHPVFPLEEVSALFHRLFGHSLMHAIPPFDSSFLHPLGEKAEEVEWWASNAYLAQTIANFFQAHVILGLEDSRPRETECSQRPDSYSAAFHFIPGGKEMAARYEKQVLVPLGEYIPFEWCRTLAAQYGISGSFTRGTETKVLQGPIPLGISICYEELYGNLVRDNRLKGAHALVNLTNDGWYPNSRLPKQHFDHARLRSVENGIPVVRACNTGVTAGLDSLGRVVGVLGENPLEGQEVADSIRIDLPLYHYSTLYSRFGDFPIIAIACLLCLLEGGKRMWCGNR